MRNGSLILVSPSWPLHRNSNLACLRICIHIAIALAACEAGATEIADIDVKRAVPSNFGRMAELCASQSTTARLP